MDRKYFARSMRNYCLPSVILFALVTVGIYVGCWNVAKNSVFGYKIELYADGYQGLAFFLPLISSIVMVPLFYFQKEKDFLTYALVRNARYILIQILSLLLVTAGSVFCSLYFAFCLSYLTIDASLGWSSRLLEYDLGFVQADHPFAFVFFWCIGESLLVTLFVLFGLMLVIVANNVFLAVISPFLYYVVENVLTSILQISKYSLTSAYALNRLSPEVQHWYYYLWGVLSFVIIMGGLIIILGIIRRRNTGLPFFFS